MNHSLRGFTLVELIMVIVLVGIISIYAAPRFNLSGYDVTESAGEVVEAIRYTQALAMQHSGLADSDGDGNSDYYCFQVAGNNYTVTISDSDSNALVTVSDPVSGAASYTQSWSSGISLTPSVNDLCFSSRGEPVDTGGTTLTSDVTITVASGSSNSTVTVEQLTGYTHR